MSNKPQLLLHAEELKNKMQHLEILTPRTSGHLCHRSAALLCNLVCLKNKAAFKKIHLHIAYIYS